MGKKFFVIVEGVETGAQRCLVQMIRDIGQTKVSSPEDCDYFLVFYRIVSRVAADIGRVLAKVPANKPVILLVLHETNDRNLAFAESSRQVHDLNVVLTVDFLFCNEHLLDSSCNIKSWAQIQNHLGRSNQLIGFQNTGEWLKNLVTTKKLKILGVILFIEIVVLVIIVLVRKNNQGPGLSLMLARLTAALPGKRQQRRPDWKTWRLAVLAEGLGCR
ncbi:hypothetical protein CCH79_00000625, partial [Gambusia affinis]